MKGTGIAQNSVTMLEAPPRDSGPPKLLLGPNKDSLWRFPIEHISSVMSVPDPCRIGPNIIIISNPRNVITFLGFETARAGSS